MKLGVRRIGKWFLWLLAGGLVLAAAYVVVLAFPGPLFAHRATFGDYRVYSDQPIPSDMGRVIDQVAWRVRAMEPGGSRAGASIYLCRSPGRYAFFAFLTRMNPESLAISLSVANSMFVSMTRVETFRASNAGVLRHTRFEGNLAEVIAHEIAHFHSIDQLGYRRHLAQPVWKSEGWAEYQANLAAIHADPTYDLPARIHQLLDDTRWASAPRLARDMWEWQLLVEFLGEVRGFRLEDLVQDQVTKSSTRDQMLAWYRANSPDPG